ncbi:hypothetical protein LP414_27885 [Polaromonas sp. P1(28)-13]|nr:hypothetical protein LP414_27885 [Polaromonas sp. P1(28)-13]
MTAAEGTISTNAAAIISEATARANADSAFATQTDAIVSTANTDRNSFNSAITTEQTTRSNADDALTSQVNSVIATANTDRGTSSAAVQAEQTARANADAAISSQVTTLQASVDGNTAAIQTRSHYPRHANRHAVCQVQRHAVCGRQDFRCSYKQRFGGRQRFCNPD